MVQEQVQTKKDKEDKIHRLYFELTADGKIRTALIEQFFIKDIKSKVIFSDQLTISNSFASLEDFTKENKKKIKDFVISVALKIKDYTKLDKEKIANKIERLEIKKNIGTTLILPAELVSNTFYKARIRNNYDSTKKIEERIAKHIEKDKDGMTEIMSDRKDIVNGNLANKEIIKIDHLPRKLHKANVYVLKSFVDTDLYKWLIKTLHKNRYVGEIFTYSELKAVRKSFSFFRINENIQPIGENLVDWRNDYTLVVSSTNDGFSKTKIQGGFNKLQDDLRKAFAITDEWEFNHYILDHKYYIPDEFDINAKSIMNEEDLIELHTKNGLVKLTNADIQDTIQSVIAKELEDINQITNKQETIHFGKINKIDYFDNYLKKINKENGANDFELFFDFSKDFNVTTGVSKNILMFALNEKTEFLKDNGEAVFTQKQKKEYETRQAMKNLGGRIADNSFF